MATSPYSYYLDVLSNWKTSVALESQFFVYFNLQSVNALKSNLSDYLEYLEGTRGTNWNIPQATVNSLIDDNNQARRENLIGCVFAREINVPGESVRVNNTGLGYGGYQAPITAEARAAYNQIRGIFLETNSSFLDYVIRPWIILVGYHGLVSRASGSEKNVKCNYMDVAYLGKTGPNTRIIERKIIRFFNVVPTRIDDMRTTQASEGLINCGVSFAYDSYVVLEPSGLDASLGNANKANNKVSTSGSVSPTIYSKQTTAGSIPSTTQFILNPSTESLVTTPNFTQLNSTAGLVNINQPTGGSLIPSTPLTLNPVTK
jgi:hypothetical protein